MRTLARRLYGQLLMSRCAKVVSSDTDGILKQSAIVFAPHPDDETLGCGGTIIRKKQAGADVKIVFMTDGRLSHAHLMSADQLILTRAKEALAAARQLGVHEQDVCFLKFEDGNLEGNRRVAQKQVAELLNQYSPKQVFIPYIKEPPRDHVATNQIVRAAVSMVQKRVEVFEYPVWAWHHWPWVGLYSGMQRSTLAVLKKSLILKFGLHMLKDFRCAIDIRDVLERKRYALEEHHTQMSEYLPNVNWLTLHDVAHGEWLDCFFQEYELYRRYTL